MYGLYREFKGEIYRCRLCLFHCGRRVRQLDAAISKCSALRVANQWRQESEWGGGHVFRLRQSLAPDRMPYFRALRAHSHRMGGYDFRRSENYRNFIRLCELTVNNVRAFTMTSSWLCFQFLE